MSNQKLSIALDVMGADKGIETLLTGCRQAFDKGLQASVLLTGDEAQIAPHLAAVGLNAEDGRVQIRHAEEVVTMNDKPTQIMRRGRKTSMWAAIEAVKNGDVAAAVSCGNTGALMAMSILQLRMIEGVDRPAITALWPNTRGGNGVVLDVGANVEANETQLVQFAIMGEAYYRALTGKQKPKVGLLNVGAEELKGHELIRTAATTLREADPEMDFYGFVEGDDLAKGTVDVIVTDGFTGNIALKSAEGTARMIGGWVRDSLTATLLSKLGAALMMGSLQKLKSRMDPSRVNGAPLLGLNGLVLKSHGGSEAEGIAAALLTAENLVRNPFRDEIKTTIARVARRTERALGQAEDDIKSQQKAAV
ncbi:phosphate acyltransferase PlsX [Parvularcula sp. IMCC14364]|uniref:phosphate acyltransferase PlsX n=1 Tax=Parvularcula sp. IMCC14364 TaxID=3067902 RepID=UPI0027408377|nr:phosphate acyltransferase PlsX [Parvularcula sp. IMCC14364]